MSSTRRRIADIHGNTNTSEFEVLLEKIKDEIQNLRQQIEVSGPAITQNSIIMADENGKLWKIQVAPDGNLRISFS